VFFLQLSAVAHISRVLDTEITSDRSEQPLCKIFSIEQTFLLGSRSLLYGGLEFGYSFKTHHCMLHTDCPDDKTNAGTCHVSYAQTTCRYCATSSTTSEALIPINPVSHEAAH